MHRCILRHNEIWGAANEAVLDKVHKKKKFQVLLDEDRIGPKNWPDFFEKTETAINRNSKNLSINAKAITEVSDEETRENVHV